MDNNSARHASVLERIRDPEVSHHYNMTSSSSYYPAPDHVGRVPNVNAPAAIFFAARPNAVHTSGQPVFFDDARQDLIGHQQTATPLSSTFFSNSNIEYLHSAIQRQVFLMSKGKYQVGRQSDDALRIIMRSYYLMFARNDPYQVSQELKELNDRTIGFCATKVFSEADFHAFYVKDVQDFAPPIANPMNVSGRGTKDLELRRFM